MEIRRYKQEREIWENIKSEAASSLRSQIQELHMQLIGVEEEKENLQSQLISQ